MIGSTELKQRAWNSLNNTYWTAFSVTLVANLIGGAIYSIREFFGVLAEFFAEFLYGDMMFIAAVIALLSVLIYYLLIIINVFVKYPLTVGTTRYFIGNTSLNPKFSVLFSGFKINYGGNIITMFMMSLKISLWYLLFIIPGVIKSYEYAMIPYILSDNPKISMSEAFAMTKKLMTGNKMRLFSLHLSFIGWYLLAIATCGIGFLFLMPYYEAACAEFYVQVKNESENEVITENV